MGGYKMSAGKLRTLNLFSAKGFFIGFVLLCANAALAGGLYLNEFGTPSMGAAGAGSQAEALDASTSFHNPAGMTRIDSNELMLTAGVLYGRVKFDVGFVAPVIGGGGGGNAGGFAPMGGLFYVQPLSERLRFGFNVYTISGAALDYEDNWAGRFLCQDVTLLTVSLNPALAYKLTDKLSLAAGFIALYGDLEYDVAFPGGPLPGPGTATLDGDDWEYGYNLGVLYELNERTRLGVIYLSETDLEFSGDLKVDPAGISVGSDTEIPLAQMVRGGVYHELNDKWALVGSFGWEDWSVMDDLLISTEQGTSSLPRRWHDTWHYAGGIHYKPVERWLLRAGFSYDTSPVDSADRTPDMPIDNQVRYAIGFQYNYSKTVMFGASFEYADFGNGKINRPLFKGDYEDNDIYVAAVFVSWKF